MKARVPVQLSKNQKKILHEQIMLEYEKTAKRERDNMTRRIIKVILCVLHTEFGFGLGRCAKIFNAFTKAFEEADKDEIFWEHVDRIVIDKLGLKFERDYTENGVVISETELEERNRKSKPDQSENRSTDDLGRVQIPKKWREELGMKEGDTVNMVFDGSKIILTPKEGKNAG